MTSKNDLTLKLSRNNEISYDNGFKITPTSQQQSPFTPSNEGITTRTPLYPLENVTLEQIQQRKCSSDMRQLFKVCDLDGSGHIDRYELQQICPHLNEDEINSVFNDLDRNNDGLISFNEFCQGFKELLPISYSSSTTINNNNENNNNNNITQLNNLNETLSNNHNYNHNNNAKAMKYENKLKLINKNKNILNNMNITKEEQEAKDSNMPHNENLFHSLDMGFKSLSGQDLVCDFYQTLSQDHPQCVGVFEKILCSIIEDVQKYQKEIQRLEQVYRKEKEQNESFLKQIEEEAENQLMLATEKIKNDERAKWEQEREQLKTTFRTEIADLQANLTQMETIEQKYINNKSDDDSQVLQLKSELNDIIMENRHLKSALTESQTQLAVLRSEMATLKAQYEERNHDYEHEKNSNIELNKEVDNLKQQVHILHEANKRLHDTNDDLRAHMEAFKAKAFRPPEREHYKPPPLMVSTPKPRNDLVFSNYFPSIESSSPRQQLQAITKSQTYQGITSISGLNKNSNAANTSFDADEDIDSGFSTLNGANECDTDPDLRIALNRTKLKNDESLNTTVCGGEHNSDDEAVFADGFDGENGQRVRRRKTSTLDQSNLSIKKSKKQSNLAASSESLSSPKAPIGPPDRMFKIVFAGDAAVGKSSFIMRFCKGKFVSNLNSTLGVDFQMKLVDVDGKATAIQLWDTCGQERFRAIAKSYFRRADGVVLMYDCTYERSYLNVREWISTIQEATDKKLPVILVANKTDLRDQAREDGKKVIEYEDGLRLSKEYEALFIETSAKDGTNVHESLIEIARIMRCNEDIDIKSSGIKLTLGGGEKKKACCWSS